MVTLYTNYFIDVIRSFPSEKILLSDSSRNIQAGELLTSSQHLAVGLINNGVRQGDRVILALKPGVEFLQVIYANMMIRTVVSIIDPEMGRDNYQAKLRQFQPQHAFVDSRLILLSEHPLARYVILKLNKTLPFFPLLSNCQIFTSGTWMPIVQKHFRIINLYMQSEPNFQSGNDRDDFLVTYTSGTLAEPKGVVHSYFSLGNSIRYLANMLNQYGDQAIATHLPQFALIGISAGVKVHLWSNNWNSEQKIRFINENTITTLFGPPSDYLGLIQFVTSTNSTLPICLKNIYLGSAPIYIGFLNHLIACCGQTKVTCLYGMTENLMVTYQGAREKIKEEIEGDLVGSPFPNVVLKIESDGEISVESDQLFSRYWQMEKCNRPHLTGDLGILDDKARLILRGRKKDMIIRGNFNIYPGLYEPTINKIEGVVEALMVGCYNHEKADEEIVLVVESSKQMNAATMMANLRDGEYSIDRAALPDRIEFMKLPRSGRQNKVNRQGLVKLLSTTKL